MNHNFKDITGQTFGHWKVLQWIGRDGRGKALWECRCQCGTMRVVAGGRLRDGLSKSCGCMQNVTHGETIKGQSLPEISIFQSAKQRCRNPRDPAYKNYGGRGIEFRFATFEEFLAEVGRRPSDKHSLDRINNDGHYECGNMRWATRAEQNANTRHNLYVKVGDERLMAKDWSARLGLKPNTLSKRLHHPNWCSMCAVTLPKFQRCPHIISI